MTSSTPHLPLQLLPFPWHKRFPTLSLYKPLSPVSAANMCMGVGPSAGAWESN